MNWLGKIIQKEIKPDDIVLDLGCGIMQATTDVTNKDSRQARKIFDKLGYDMNHSLSGNLKCKTILGCDIWEPYLKVVSRRYPTIKLTMSELDKFIDNSYDVVMALDVLEHLKLEDAQAVIDHMKRITRSKVIIYTPSKLISNEENIDNAWNMGKNQYQIHQCFLEPDNLSALGFRVSFPEPDKNTLGIFTKGEDHQ